MFLIYYAFALTLDGDCLDLRWTESIERKFYGDWSTVGLES
jgi:hypothetical protein